MWEGGRNYSEALVKSAVAALSEKRGTRYCNRARPVPSNSHPRSPVPSSPHPRLSRLSCPLPYLNSHENSQESSSYLPCFDFKRT